MRPTNALLPCGLVCAAAFLAAQPVRQIPTQTPPVFRAGIDIVQLDVSVLDKARKPVHGLTAEDFTVLEDGKPQHIEHFEEISVPDPVEPPAQWMKRASPDVVTNERHESRIVVIILDDALTPDDPWITKSVKAIGRDLVNHLGPNDLASVVYTLGNRQKTQDFTNDHAKLLAAVDKYTPGFASYGTLGHDDSMFYSYSQFTVHDAADYLIALPQLRKALIYVSTGVPVDASWGGPRVRPELANLYLNLAQTFQRAQRANVSVYPIDPGGLLGVYNYVLNKLLSKGLKYPAADIQAHTTENNARDYLLETAENTGGRAIVNTNDFADGIAQIFKENGSYYLLGYRQANPKGPNSYSRLGVKVNRKDVEVRTRPFNYTPKVDKQLAKSSPATQSLAGLLPDATTPLRVSVAPFARPSSVGGPTAKGDAAKEAIVAVALGFRETAPTERVVEHIEVLTRAFNTEGGALGSQTQKVDLAVRPSQNGPGGPTEDARFEVLTQVALKPGRYQLRLAADNATRKQSGSVFVDVDIPDFAKEPLSLSGVVLDSANGPTSAPKSLLNWLLPLVPTTDRDFSTTGQVTSFLRVYQGGTSPAAPVTVTTVITDVHDSVVFSRSTTLAADRFTIDRAADFRFEVPLVTLKPGPHLLTFDATLGRLTARRDVVFAVK